MSVEINIKDIIGRGRTLKLLNVQKINILINYCYISFIKIAHCNCIKKKHWKYHKIII